MVKPPQNPVPRKRYPTLLWTRRAARTPRTNEPTTLMTSVVQMWGKKLPQPVSTQCPQCSADGNRSHRTRQLQITHALASPERAYVPDRAFGGRGMK